MKYSAKKEILGNESMAELAWAAIEPLWEDLPCSNAKKLDDFLSEVTPGQRALISIDWCQKEIRNGGIVQLLSNTTGSLVPYSVEGFELIGAKPYAEILHKVIEIVGSPYPNTSTARNHLIKSLSSREKDQLKLLDDMFFNLIFSTEHDIEEYRGGFVKKNPDQFICS